MSLKTFLRKVPDLEQLRKWNIWLAIIYGLEAVAVLVVGSSQLVPLSTSYFAVDTLESTTSGSLVLAPATHHLFDINLLYLVFLVFVVLAALQLSQAIWWRYRYETNLKQSHNTIRWTEYGFTASILFVVLAMLSGVYDVSTLLVLLVLSVIVHGACWWAERATGRRSRNKNDAWAAYGVAIVAGIGMWLVVVIQLVGANVYGSGHIPTRIYWLAATTAITCLSFAVGLFYQIQKPKAGPRYRLSEQRYLLLTLLTSSILAWQIVAGTMH